MKCLVSCLLIFACFSCNDHNTSPVADEGHQTIDTSTPPALSPGDSLYNSFAAIDKSPMDMSYYPVDYPKLKMTAHNTPPPVARIVYSRPHLAGRRLFPDILKHDEPWRLGANEATELRFYREVQIEGTPVKPGLYTLYCIPKMGNWIIVLNSNTDTWGLQQDSTLDVHRFPIPVTTGHPPLEYFTMMFEKTASGADLVIAWDDVIGRLPVSFKP